MSSNWSARGPFAGRLIAMLTLPVAMYLLYATGQRALESYNLVQEANRVRAEIGALRSRNLEMQQELERRRTDGFVEKVAREELGLVKAGDQPLVVVPTALEAPVPLVVERAPTMGPEPLPRWKEWLHFFFGT